MKFMKSWETWSVRLVSLRVAYGGNFEAQKFSKECNTSSLRPTHHVLDSVQ